VRCIVRDKLNVQLDEWELIEKLPIQQASSCFLIPATPLFEKERNFLGLALVPNGSDPVGLHGPASATAFSASDNPMNSGEIHRPQILE
jgi:hypothetical protein